jgi:hypothetical protein
VRGREDFQYAIFRVVPHVERGECLNAGVVLFSRRLGFLGAKTGLDEAALAAMAPDCDPVEGGGGVGRLGRGAPACDPFGVRHHLDTLERVAAGASDGGPIAALDASERFHWLTAPSSTTVQSSAVHTGLTSDPAGELEHLFERLVSR